MTQRFSPQESILPLWGTMPRAKDSSMTNPSPEMLARFQRFAQWLKLAIDGSGVGVAEIAIKSGITKNTIYTYMRGGLHSDGRYRAPTEETIRALAAATRADVLTGLKTMGFDGGPPALAPGEVSRLPIDAQTALARFIQTMTPGDIVYLPRIGKASAGNLITGRNISDLGFEKVGILRSSIPEKVPLDELFILKIEGYCLANAMIADGDSLVCRRSETAQSGQVVIVFEGDEVIAKRYKEDSSGKWLETDPMSGTPRRVRVGPDAQIMGVAITRTGPIH